jgi:hypothetical protein
LAQNSDLIFLARQWEAVELPKDKKYLLKYFDTPLQQMFIRYVYLFGDYANFQDHTGVRCQLRWMKELNIRLQSIQKAHKEARQNMDIEKLAFIESGNSDLWKINIYF